MTEITTTAAVPGAGRVHGARLMRRATPLLVSFAILICALAVTLVGAAGTTPSVLVHLPEVHGKLVASPSGARLDVAATIGSGSGVPQPIRITWYLGAPGDREPWKHPAYAAPWRSLDLAPYAVRAVQWDTPLANLGGPYQLTVVVHLFINHREVHATAASPTGPPLVLPQG